MAAEVCGAALRKQGRRGFATAAAFSLRVARIGAWVWQVALVRPLFATLSPPNSWCRKTANAGYSPTALVCREAFA